MKTTHKFKYVGGPDDGKEDSFTGDDLPDPKTGDAMKIKGRFYIINVDPETGAITAVID